MKKFRTGDKVAYGIYGSLKSLDLRYVGADNDKLDGKRDATYIRIPSLLLLGLAPLIGGVFVLGFPLIVIISIIALPVYYGTKHIAGMTKEVAEKATDMNWEPSAAYMEGKEVKNGADEKTESTPKELAELEKEVYEKRRVEK